MTQIEMIRMIMYFITCNILIPLQNGGVPVQLPSGRHILVLFPMRSCIQEYSAVLPTVVLVKFTAKPTEPLTGKSGARQFVTKWV